MIRRTPKAPAPVRPDAAVFVCFAPFTARFDGRRYLISSGQRLAADHPLLGAKSPWRGHFHGDGATVGEIEEAARQLAAYKAAVNPAPPAPVKVMRPILERAQSLER